ncbi:MAG: hypothetical protein J2P18_10720 [Nocardia sp.]|nr:hypothetical protein [Nocardia sp.]
MQFLTSRGPFCRDCGMATYRKMTVESLWLGWWGIISSIVNPIMMLANLGPRGRILELGAPIPGSPRPPMDPGKPLYQRPGFLAPLIIFALPVLVLILLIIIGMISSLFH